MEGNKFVYSKKVKLQQRNHFCDLNFIYNQTHEWNVDFFFFTSSSSAL